MKIHTTLLTSILSLLILSCLVSPVSAVSKRMDDVQEIRKEIQETRQEVKEVRQEIGKDIREKIASRVGELQKFLGVRMSLGKATLKSITDTTLVVEKDGTTYTVNTGKFTKCTTQFRRRFWGVGKISEMQVGDIVNVFGLWANDEKTAVNACLVRDVSIQKRFGVFFGEVTSVSSTGFVMSTSSDKRADQTVTISATTKIIDRKEKTILQSEIQVGHKVRVSGLWDNQSNTVTEVTKIKDFDLPVRVTPTPTP